MRWQTGQKEERVQIVQVRLTEPSEVFCFALFSAAMNISQMENAVIPLSILKET